MTMAYQAFVPMQRFPQVAAPFMISPGVAVNFGKVSLIKDMANEGDFLNPAVFLDFQQQYFQSVRDDIRDNRVIDGSIYFGRRNTPFGQEMINGTTHVGRVIIDLDDDGRINNSHGLNAFIQGNLIQQLRGLMNQN